MTQQRRDEHSTQFGNWLRTQYQREIGSQNFSAQNLDYIWHNYREGWFILIEEKRYKRMQDNSQKDTHGILSQLLSIASGSKVFTMRGQKGVEYRGYYLIVFENTTPDDGWMNINGQRADIVGLLRLLQTGRFP